VGELRPGGLAELGHPLPEAAARLRARGGDGDADRQLAAVGRDLAKGGGNPLDDRALQVDGDALEQEQGRAGRVQARRQQRFRDRIGGEVGRDEADMPAFEVEPGNALDLVRLGGRVVELEPADARLGVAEGAAVVAGAADHDLPDAPAEGVHHRVVEEGRPRPQVLVHPAVGGLLPVRDVGGERPVGRPVAVVRRDPLELEPVGGDAARRLRCGPVLHHHHPSLIR
jgi:hypothetical protein